MSEVRRLLLGGLLAWGMLAVGMWLGSSQPRSPLGADALLAASGAVEAGRAYGWLQDFLARNPQRWPGGSDHEHAPGEIADAFVGALGSGRVERSGEHRNVIATLAGDPRCAVVLAAHHDAVKGSPGAVDDAGAVAALLEAARVLGSARWLTERRTRRCDIVFAIFDAEEAGLLGSKAWLAGLGTTGRARIRAAVAVELVGWHRDSLTLLSLPHGFAWDAAGPAPAWLVGASRAAAADAGVRVAVGDPWFGLWVQGAARSLRLGVGSDAEAFLSAGVPGVLLTGSSLSGFYEAYHSPRDDLDQVAPERLDEAARALVATALELATGGGGPPELDRPWLAFGGRVLRPSSLVLLGGLAGLLGALAGLGALRSRGLLPVGLLLAGGATVLALTLSGSVAGFVVGVPAALTATAAMGSGRARPAWAALGIAPMLVLAGLLVAAARGFGAIWIGSPGEAAGLLLGPFLLAAGTLAPGAQGRRQARP